MDEDFPGRIQLVEYIDRAESCQLTQFTAFFDLAFEIAANDDTGHVISYIDLFEPVKPFHGSAGSP